MSSGLAASGGGRAWRAALVFVVAVATYLPMMRNQYALDDMLIASTAQDRAHAPVASLFDHEFFSRYNQDTYRPFAAFTTMIDHRLGVDPRHAGHVQNILWHAAGALLVLIFAGRLLPPGAALLAALFFAVHPAASEATVSIGYREDSIVTCLLLAALLLTWDGERRRRAGALVAYGLALFTKENAIVFPALLLLARLVLDRPLVRRALVRELAVFTLVTAGYLFVRFHVMASPHEFADPMGGTTAQTLVAVPQLFAHYLRLLVEPWPQLVLYDHMFPVGTPWLPQLPWILLDAAFLGGALWLTRARPVMGFGLLWFAIALSPTLHVVPMRVMAADRFVHVSLVGGAFAVGSLFALAHSAVARRIAQAAAVLGLAALVVLTEHRIAIWHDDATLWTDTLRYNPRAYIGRFYLASKLQAAGQLSRARDELVVAIDDCPRDSRFGRTRFCAYFASKLGFLSLQMQELGHAQLAFAQALQFDDQYTPAIIGLGFVALGLNDLPGARRYADAATALAPGLPLVRGMIDDLRTSIGRAEARRD